LINLSRLPRGEVFFVGLPLALAGLDGSPIRALAILGDPPLPRAIPPRRSRRT